MVVSTARSRFGSGGLVIRIYFQVFFTKEVILSIYSEESVDEPVGQNSLPYDSNGEYEHNNDITPLISSGIPH
jgi:hypothetical protein